MHLSRVSLAAEITNAATRRMSMCEGFEIAPETGTWVTDMFHHSLDPKIMPQLEGAYILTPV